MYPLPGAVMSEEQRAVIGAQGRAAYCYSCRTLLAMKGGPAGHPGGPVSLGDGLIPRPDKERRTGLPRFGPPLARDGHEARRGGAWRSGSGPRTIGNPGAIYVNCPACDRGQVVRWP